MKHSNLSKLALASISPLVFIANAHADQISDLLALVAKTRVVIGNNASIDNSNPENVQFTTSMSGQLVELNLSSSRLNDSFITAINYDQSSRLNETSSRTSRTVTPTNITFGNLQVKLDGCDITSQLLSQCATNSCWDGSLSPVPTTTLTGLFATKVYLNLSMINPNTAGCSGFSGSTFFDSTHMNHTLQFSEQTVGKAGNLNYQVIVYNTTAQ